MGVFMSSPKTEKKKEDGGAFECGKCLVEDKSSWTCYGVASMQGWRQSMEDAHMAIRTREDRGFDLFGVFDGHGGATVSHWVSKNLYPVLLEQLEKANINGMHSIAEMNANQYRYCIALRETFFALDDNMRIPSVEEEFRIAASNTSQNKIDITKAKDIMQLLLQDSQIRIAGRDPGSAIRDIIDAESKDTPIDDLHQSIDTNSSPTDESDVDSKSSTDENTMIDTEENDSGFEDEDHTDRHFDTIQDQMQNPPFPGHPSTCGATAVVAVIEYSAPSIIVANSGDSRAVLSRNGVAIPLSRDHKPDIDIETARIDAAGGRIVNGRVEGNLNLSRSIGDLGYKSDSSLHPSKQKITSDPEIRVIGISPEDEFLVLACDGIWECKSNQDVVDFVRARLKTHTLSNIAAELCDSCLSPSPFDSDGLGCDNMTVLIVALADIFKTKTARHTKRLLFAVPPVEEPENIFTEEIIKHSSCSAPRIHEQLDESDINDSNS